MNTICRVKLLVRLLGLATIVLSLMHDFLSTRRAISTSQDYHFEKDGSAIDDGPYVTDSERHFMWDEKLETRYSTTHQKMRGQFSMILNDNDEINDGNNNFQHEGILRTSSKKHGKWMDIRNKISPDAEFTVAGETIHKAGTKYSKFVDDIRLVIDVNQSIIFPSMEMKNITANDRNDDDNRICHILRLLTGRKSLDVVPKAGIPPIVLNVTADCNFLNQKVNGQGNTILALYGLRMITAIAKVDFKFQCKNNDFEGWSSNDDNSNDYKKEKSRKLRWVFPWFASFQSASNDRDPWPYMGSAPTEDQVCSSHNSDLDHGNGIMPLEKMADQIRDDVRKMALQLMGSQTEDPKRIHPLIPLDVEPWIPNIAPDDVIIHFPCYSDVNDWEDTTTRRKSHVGILQFSEYTKHINENVKSIGIIREASGEPRENSNENVCNRASTLLLEYLQSIYTNHPVSISIYENDTLPLQYARIAMAKQSFSSFSTFGMIPIIGTFGEGYFQPSDFSTPATPSGNTGNQNSIIRNIISGKYKGFENINLMNGNVLSPHRIETMSFSDVSDWLLKSSS